MCPTCRQKYLNQSTTEEDVQGNPSDSLLRNTEFQDSVESSTNQGKSKSHCLDVLTHQVFIQINFNTNIFDQEVY